MPMHQKRSNDARGRREVSSQIDCLFGAARRLHHIPLGTLRVGQHQQRVQLGLSVLLFMGQHQSFQGQSMSLREAVCIEGENSPARQHRRAPAIE